MLKAFRVSILAGIIAAAALVSIEPTPSEAATVCDLPGRSGKLNMRRCPSFNCRVTGVDREGTAVRALAHSNWWIKVRVKGKTGWMRQRHLCGDDIDFG